MREDTYFKVGHKGMIGKDNPKWRGDNVGYDAIHGWVKRHIKKSIYCKMCKQKRKLEVANISQQYKRDLSDWEWLCRKCHMTKDGRLKVFLTHSYKKSQLPIKNYK